MLQWPQVLRALMTELLFRQFLKPQNLQKCNVAGQRLALTMVTPITCTACADTCDGPQGAEAKAADCFMDLTVQEIGD